MLTGVRLAVWGDPIDHSLSPVLHRAAYRTLGLEWTYDRLRVDEPAFPGALASLGSEWRGLSLTMPLKQAAYQAARRHDRHARLTGAVNTLLLDGPDLAGFNTDVGGMATALFALGALPAENARVVGSGATAASAVVALAESGVRRVEIVARRPDRAGPLIALAQSLGASATARELDAAPYPPHPLTIAALPGDARIPDPAAAALAAPGGMLVDAVYGQWPTQLASAWTARGSAAHSGEEFLLRQALLQVRIFAAGDAATPLPAEQTVLAAMRDAVAGH